MNRKERRGQAKTSAGPAGADGDIAKLVRLYEGGQFRDALVLAERILARRRDVDILHLAAGLASRLGESAKAVKLFQDVLALRPDHPEAHFNLGQEFAKAGEFEAAVAAFRQAIAVRPADPASHVSLGRALGELGRLDDAIEVFRGAAALRPADAGIQNDLGTALHRLGRLDDAEASYRRAVGLEPGRADAHYNLASLLRDQDKLDEALASFQRALSLDPGHDGAAAFRFHVMQETCAWEGIEAAERILAALTLAALRRGVKCAETPFINVARAADPELNLGVAKAWSGDIARRIRPGYFHDGRRAPKATITLGYLSNDFHDHATAHLMRSLFGLHDRAAFRVHAYSTGADDGSGYRQRIAADCDSFIDIAGLTASAAADRIHADQVDILIDLKGYTQGARLDVAALRPAPIQVAYLGFPGTTGADFFDYVLTDRIVTPEAEARYYAEQFAYLPHCYQVNDSTQAIADRAFGRAALGLPEDAFVFASFNRAFKIEPVMFAAWMRILAKLPSAVLWLFPGHPIAEANLRRAAERRGIDPKRLVFAEKMPKPEHLKRLGLADLALDTRIYSGHTTTSDALWAGLPVVALRGGHFASRVSTSVLAAAGMSELVAADLAAYEALVVGLAEDCNRLAALKAKLVANRPTAPLFDTPRFTRNLEALFREMWRRFASGAQPSRIDAAEA